MAYPDDRSLSPQQVSRRNWQQDELGRRSDRRTNRPPARPITPAQRGLTTEFENKQRATGVAPSQPPLLKKTIPSRTGSDLDARRRQEEQQHMQRLVASRRVHQQGYTPSGGYGGAGYGPGGGYGPRYGYGYGPGGGMGYGGTANRYYGGGGAPSMSWSQPTYGGYRPPTSQPYPGSAWYTPQPPQWSYDRIMGAYNRAMGGY